MYNIAIQSFNDILKILKKDNIIRTLAELSEKAFRFAFSP